MEDKVMDYFPEYIYDTMDIRKYDITIDDLMIMRMGIDTEENNLLDVLATSNWIKTTIELPLLSALVKNSDTVLWRLTFFLPFLQRPVECQLMI